MDDYDYNSEYENFDTADFDSLGNSEQYGGEYDWGASNQFGGSEQQGGQYDFNLSDSMPQGMYDMQFGGGNQSPQYDPMGSFQNENPYGSTGQDFFEPGQSGQPNQYLDMFNNALKGSGGILNTLFAPKAGGEASTRDIMGGLAPFLAALYNKNQAPKTAQAANQYIQGQQQRLDPFQPYRQGAADEMLQRRSEIEALMKNPTSSSMYNSQYNTGMQEALAKGGKSGQRFAAFMPRQAMYNAQKSQMDTLKQLQGMYTDSAKLAGSNINPAGLEALLARGMTSNQAAADPWQGMFGALGQLSTKQAPGVDESTLAQLLKLAQRN